MQPVEVEVTIGPAEHRSMSLSGLSYSPATVAFANPVPTVSLTAPTSDPSGATIAYSLGTGSEGCTVDGNGAVTITGTGDCIIKATATRADYDAVSDFFTITINPGTISLSGFKYAPATVTFANPVPTVALTAPTANPSGATISYAAAGSSTGCSVAPNGTVTITGAGTCVVEATAVLANYNNKTASFSITINRGTMALSGLGYGTNSFPRNNIPSVTAPTSNPSGATIRYGVKPDLFNPISICTVHPDTGALTVRGEGTCTIEATGSLANYNDVTIEVEVTIGEIDLRL